MVFSPYPDNVRHIDDYFVDVSAGRLKDRYSVHKFGANADVGAGAGIFEDIWDAGGAYPWPTSAQTLRVRGGNAADDNDGGAGARKIIVEGLDSNWDRASEEITLAGADASSATATSFWRISRAYVTDVGTYTGANTGNILIENTSDTDLIADIQAGKGQTEMSMYTIPAGYTGYLARVTIEVESGKPAEVRVFQRQNADDVTTPFTGKRLVHDTLSLDGAEIIRFFSLIPIPEKSDIWADAAAPSGGSATQIDVEYDLIVMANTALGAIL